MEFPFISGNQFHWKPARSASTSLTGPANPSCVSGISQRPKPGLGDPLGTQGTQPADTPNEAMHWFRLVDTPAPAFAMGTGDFRRRSRQGSAVTKAQHVDATDRSAIAGDMIYIYIYMYVYIYIYILYIILYIYYIYIYIRYIYSMSI